SNDHESTALEEAREKLRAGLKVFIREGSAAKNLEALLPLVTKENKHRFCFCTDDRHPQDIMSEGHIDHVIRKAIGLGLDPVTAIQLGSHFTAVHFGLTRVGAVAAGYQADLIVVEDLTTFRIREVYRAGELVAREGKFLPDESGAVVAPPVDSVRLPADLREASFVVPAPAAGAKIRVIGMLLHQLLTSELVEAPTVRDGQIVADVERDILKLAVIERHRGSGNIGVGFVHGFGLKRGALASTVGHDSHNLTVLGTNDADMLLAARALEKAQGGQVVVADGQVLATMPLPIAGLMSTESAEVLVGQQESLRNAYRTLGSPVEDPFMTLSFMPLAVIPKLKLTDLGLVDVDRFDVVPLVVGD
ncbi:MAG: adenine deaminase C-terminal domain-containing protein, partial [Phycisphaerales bacterium JB038]